jgi:hypothetical protein
MDYGATGGEGAHGFKFLCGGGHGGLDCGDLAEPALLLCLLEPVAQVGVDLFQPRHLSWVNPEEWASDAGFSELTVWVLFVRFLLWIWEPGGMGDSADDEARVSAVDPWQGVVEADEGSAGDAGG